MDLKKISSVILSAFNMPKAPLTPIPPPLVYSGANNRPGLSARNIAARIIARQAEAGAPVGALSDGSRNISEAMELVRVEEIVNALLTELKVEIAIPPGTPISGAGGNAGGPVAIQGSTTAYAQGSGIVR